MKENRKILKLRGFFFKINKIKPLAGLIKKKKIQINKIVTKRGDFTTDATKIKRIIRDYYE